MSQTMQPMGAPPPAGPPGVPPGMMLNPAYGQWEQMNAAAQKIIQANQQKQAQFEAACALIRQDGLRGFKLDIEADSTIAADEQAERAARTEFLQQIIPLLENITPIAQGNPSMAELASEVGMFAVRAFRVARPLEEAFEKAFNVLGQMPPQPQKGGEKAGVNPQIEQAKIQANMMDTQAKTHADLTDTQTKAEIAQATLAQKQQEMAAQMTIERERMAMQQQSEQGRAAIEAAKMQSSERVQNARVLRTEAGGTRGLV